MTNAVKLRFQNIVEALARSLPSSVHFSYQLIDEEDFSCCPKCGKEVPARELKHGAVCGNCARERKYMTYIGLIDDNDNWHYEHEEPKFYGPREARYLKFTLPYSYKTKEESAKTIV